MYVVVLWYGSNVKVDDKMKLWSGPKILIWWTDMALKIQEFSVVNFMCNNLWLGNYVFVGCW